MAKADELRQRYEDAKERINKIGQPEPHLASCGRLAKLEIESEVCHQAYACAPNYWSDPHFDTALTKVIRKRFSALADEALALMALEADDALVAEEQSLRERLAEIERVRANRA